MKYLLAITLLVAMVVQTFHTGIIEVDFLINQDQIAATLCENKDQPEMQCHGSCQLKKELEKENRNATSKLTHDVKPFIITRPVAQNGMLLPDNSKKYLPYKPLKAIHFTAAILHPPAV